MTEWMIEQGFIQSKNDPCLYHKPAKLERVQLAQTDKIQQLVAKGYMQSKRDSTLYYYPGMNVSTQCHVDDLITRGHRRATELFSSGRSQREVWCKGGGDSGLWLSTNLLCQTHQ